MRLVEGLDVAGLKGLGQGAKMGSIAQFLVLVAAIEQLPLIPAKAQSCTVKRCYQAHIASGWGDTGP